MARNGSGVYSAPSGNPVVGGTTITATWANTLVADLGGEITNSLDKGGRTTPTANLPMGTYKLTGLGAGSAAGESLRYDQMNGHVAYSIVALAATTADIGAAYAETINATGSGVTVTAFPNAPAVGTRRTLIFSGANTLTHSAGLLLFTSANITTASGDRADFVYTSAGVWTMTGYQRKAGNAMIASFGAGAEATPSITFAGDPNTGFWNSNPDEISMSLGGSTLGVWGTANAALAGSGAISLIYGGATYSFSSSLSLATTTGQAAITTANVTAGTSGLIKLQSGAHTNGGNAGKVQLISGASSAVAGGAGGAIEVTAGVGHSSGGTGGSVAVDAGDGGIAGDIAIRAGNATGAGQNGGDLTLAMGSGTVAGGRLLVDSNITGVMRVTSKSSLLVVDAAGVPSITGGGGTSPTIVGTNTAFKITLGTTPGTTVTVNFTETFTNNPIIIPRYQTADINVRASSISTTAVTFTFASSPASGGILDVICIGREAT